MNLTNLNTVMLPPSLHHVAPLCMRRGELWFDKENQISSLDLDCEIALVAKGIGYQYCPTDGDWAAFCISGAIIATLTERYVTPPTPLPFSWGGEAERFSWEALWQAVQGHGEKLDKGFVATMLRVLVPRERYAPPERPWYVSDFAERWATTYPDRMFERLGNLRIGCLKHGEKAVQRMPESLAASVGRVAEHIPPMLDIVVQHVSRN